MNPLLVSAPLKVILKTIELELELMRVTLTVPVKPESENCSMTASRTSSISLLAGISRFATVMSGIATVTPLVVTVPVITSVESPSGRSGGRPEEWRGKGLYEKGLVKEGPITENF